MKELLVVANYMRSHGWCQGEISDSNGRVCLIGAIIHSIECPLTRARAYSLLERYLGTKAIHMWNDDVGRTMEQAIEALLGAARMAQIGEPMRRYEVIPIHTPPVETPPEPKAPVVNPEKVEPEKVE